jgi:dTDP-4-dehydrorhamnose 3,5-epimerase
LEIKKTKIEGLFILEPKVFGDDRGYFIEAYKESFFKENFPKLKFNQVNETKSSKGVLRGIHFQKPPLDQTKLCRVILGEVLDVAVDLRKDSQTYGMYESFRLSGDNKKQLLIPSGFGHGFVVLSDFAVFQYYVDNPYSPEHEGGLIYNDADLNIDWEIDNSLIKLSERDNFLDTLKIKKDKDE